jgi:nitrite reductase/ring-hydroxylating ferredoxin subunit
MRKLCLATAGWTVTLLNVRFTAGRFEVKTGKGLGAPITCDLKILPVRIEGDAIQVNVSG